MPQGPWPRFRRARERLVRGFTRAVAAVGPAAPDRPAKETVYPDPAEAGAAFGSAIGVEDHHHPSVEELESAPRVLG